MVTEFRTFCLLVFYLNFNKEKKTLMIIKMHLNKNMKLAVKLGT